MLKEAKQSEDSELPDKQNAVETSIDNSNKNVNIFMNPEINYKLLKLLDSNPNLTQRQMAEEMGLSLGKFNFCLKKLVKKGIVKIDRFTTSSNKAGYMYLLTPRGIEEKTIITTNFLKRKMIEYEVLKREIQELSQEIKLEP